MAGLICQAIYYSLLLSLRNVWGKMFTNDPAVLEVIRDYLPYSLLVQTFDVTQAISSGVLRGCGFQLFGGVVNILCYYCICVPLAAALVFLVAKDLKMIYYSFTIGIFIQAVIFVVRILLINWWKISDEIRAHEDADGVLLGEASQEDVPLLGQKKAEAPAESDGPVTPAATTATATTATDV